MLGVIGGASIVFYALYSILVYALLRVCNIQVREDYETINEK